MSGCGNSAACSGGVCRRTLASVNPTAPSVKPVAERLELFLHDVGSSYVMLEYPTAVQGEDLARFHVEIGTALAAGSQSGQDSIQWDTLSKDLKGGVLKKKGLEPGTVYSFRIRGLMMPQKEWSPFSPVLAVSTLSEVEEKSRPGKVKGLLQESANAEQDAKVRIQWETVGGELVQRYQVDYRQLSSVGLAWTTVSDNLTGTQVIKKNMKPATDYVFRVRSESSTKGWSAWSVPSAPVSTLLSLNEAFYRLFGNASKTLVRGSDLQSVPLEQLGNKLVGLYFSASWCPPCQQFTPRLAQFYNQVVSSGRPFEVIFVSADRDENSFKQYFSKMPWIALDYHNSKRTEIPSLYQVQGIPRLIVFNKEAKLVSNNAVTETLTLETFDRWSSM